VDAENRNHGEEEDQRDLKEYEDEKVEAAAHPQRNRADVRGTYLALHFSINLCVIINVIHVRFNVSRTSRVCLKKIIRCFKSFFIIFFISTSFFALFLNVLQVYFVLH